MCALGTGVKTCALPIWLPGCGAEDSGSRWLCRGAAGRWHGQGEEHFEARARPFRESRSGAEGARLDQHLAGLDPAPGAPRDMRDLLKGALGRAQVAAVAPEVGLADADEGEVGEMKIGRA